jgi:hypothetical protein
MPAGKTANSAISNCWRDSECLGCENLRVRVLF